MYFNYGGTQIPGVDGVPAKTGTSLADPGVKWAIETWAKDRMNGSPAPLYVIFVDHGNGRIEPREVKIGLRGGGQAEVLDGLAEGEAVATRANFLIDSESRLKAALEAIAPGATGAGTAAASPHGSHAP